MTKRSDDIDVDSQRVAAVPPSSDFGIQHSEHNYRRRSSQRNKKEKEYNEREDDEDDFSTTTSEDLHEFDVYEREGYDKIMRTVAGIGGDGADYAKEVCDFLEIFESLSPTRYVCRLDRHSC